MSDEAAADPTPDVATPDAPPQPDAPDPSPSSVHSPPPAPDDGGDPFADLPDDQAVFDRGYVDKLRREGARYRTEAKSTADQLSTYDDVFSVYDPADRDVWLDLARTWVNDPVQAANVMQQIATSVLNEGGDVGAEPAPEPAAGDDGPLTAEGVREMMQAELAEREAKAREAAEVENIYSEMRDAGFDPKSRDGFSILWMANNETGGDIAKAIEQFKADRQKVIDEYVAGRTNGATTPAPNGVVASAHTPIQNLDDARAAADAFLRSQVGD